MWPHGAAGGTQRGASEGCGLTKLLEGPNEVGPKGVAYRTHSLVQAQQFSFGHQFVTSMEQCKGDFVKNWHSPIRHTHILADR